MLSVMPDQIRLPRMRIAFMQRGEQYPHGIGRKNLLETQRISPTTVVPSGTFASSVVRTINAGKNINMPEYAAALAVLSTSCSRARKTAFRKWRRIGSSESPQRVEHFRLPCDGW